MYTVVLYNTLTVVSVKSVKCYINKSGTFKLLSPLTHTHTHPHTHTHTHTHTLTHAHTPLTHTHPHTHTHTPSHNPHTHAHTPSHNPQIVVMACREVENAKPKCECYWPDKNCSKDFAGITVTTVS